MKADYTETITDGNKGMYLGTIPIWREKIVSRVVSKYYWQVRLNLCFIKNECYSKTNYPSALYVLFENIKVNGTSINSWVDGMELELNCSAGTSKYVGDEGKLLMWDEEEGFEIDHNYDAGRNLFEFTTTSPSFTLSFDISVQCPITTSTPTTNGYKLNLFGQFGIDDYSGKAKGGVFNSTVKRIGNSTYSTATKKWDNFSILHTSFSMSINSNNFSRKVISDVDENEKMIYITLLMCTDESTSSSKNLSNYFL